MSLIGGESGKMSHYVRAGVFFLVSTALLVLYCLQQGKITTQGGTWIAITILGTASCAAIRDSDLVATIVMLLMGVSGGMVLGNTTITLKN